MEKKFPASIWVVVKGACLFVGVDVGIDQPSFLTIYVNISLIDTNLVIAYRLNLGALENQARLKGIQDVEVKISFYSWKLFCRSWAHFNTDCFSGISSIYHDPCTVANVEPIAVIFIRRVVGRIYPSENPFCVAVSHIDTTMAHRVSKVIMPVGAMKCDTGIIDEECCPGHTR